MALLDDGIVRVEVKDAQNGWRRETFLSRKDDGVGVGLYDSIAWIYEVHLKLPDNPAHNSAVITGNEDSPVKILLFTSENPNHDEQPDQAYRLDADDNYVKFTPNS